MGVPSKEQVQTHLKRHFLWWVVAVFVLSLSVLYTLGFRPGPGLTVTRVGTLLVTNVPEGANVYTDAALRGSATGNTLRAALVPGNHTVIVSTSDTNPWTGIVSIRANQTTTVSPVLVPKSVPVKELSGTEAATAISEAKAAVLPTESAPLTIGCTQVYVLGNRVVAAPNTESASCKTPSFLCSGTSCEPTIVFAPVDTLRSVNAYPGHENAIIVAVGGKVYALGLDPRTPQFFSPVLQGTAPITLSGPDGSLLVVDAGKAYQVSL